MSTFGVFFGLIPDIFRSEYSGKPILKCIACSVSLVESNIYVIQKRFVAGEMVFEMAMYERCGKKKMVLEYSEETRQNIAAHIREQFEKLNAGGDEDGPRMIQVRQIDEVEEGKGPLNQCIEFCVVCGAKRVDCHRQSSTGFCRDDEIVAQVTPIGRTPLMVCERCELRMASLVSQQTRHSWDRFVHKHFDGPPGVEMDSPTTYSVAL